jgi:hypothetical protein
MLRAQSTMTNRCRLLLLLPLPLCPLLPPPPLEATLRGQAMAMLFRSKGPSSFLNSERHPGQRRQVRFSLSCSLYPHFLAVFWNLDSLFFLVQALLSLPPSLPPSPSPSPSPSLQTISSIPHTTDFISLCPRSSIRFFRSMFSPTLNLVRDTPFRSTHPARTRALAFVL